MAVALDAYSVRNTRLLPTTAARGDSFSSDRVPPTPSGKSLLQRGFRNNTVCNNWGLFGSEYHIRWHSYISTELGTFVCMNYANRHRIMLPAHESIIWL